VKPFIFRSMDMYRTGDARIDDLRIYARALSSVDWKFLQDMTGRDNLSDLITYGSLMKEIAKDLPAELKVDLISAESVDTIRLDVRTIRASFSVRGHINITLKPSSSSNYRRFVEFTVAAVDLHGIIGTLASLLVRVRELADETVRSFSGRFNNELATQLDPIFDRGGTLTISNIIAEHNGLRISAAIGLLMGGRPDPCQGLRNQVLLEEKELAVALREGLSSQAIAAQRQALQRKRQEVDDCRARH
jgi:hypothetical protein